MMTYSQIRYAVADYDYWLPRFCRDRAALDALKAARGKLLGSEEHTRFQLTLANLRIACEEMDRAILALQAIDRENSAA